MEYCYKIDLALSHPCQFGVNFFDMLSFDEEWNRLLRHAVSDRLPAETDTKNRIMTAVLVRKNLH